MSFYNMLFGKNPLSEIMLKLLDLKEEDCGRFRDAYLTEEGNIIVYTRNGGNNRECWDGGDNCNCPGCIITNKLPKHPNYIRDYDDEFDSTYAYIEFSIPENYKDKVAFLQTGDADLVGEKFKKYIDCLKEVKNE